MTTDGQTTKGSLRELEPLFADEAAGRDRLARHSTLRLQPTVLPPPPDEHGRAAPRGASPEDDLDLGLEADDFARRRQLLLAAAGLAIAIAGTVAFLIFGPTSADKPAVATRPPVETVPPVEPIPQVIVAPAPATIPPVVAPAAPSAAAATPDNMMGQVSNELVPPSTDGLSPARRVNSVRIVVDGDREVRN